MAFQINSTSPPSGCDPVGSGYELHHPESTGLAGDGLACGAIGYPRLTLRFAKLSPAGWEWYTAFTGTNLSVTLSSLQAYDQYKSGGPGWVTYSSAIMHRPTHAGYYYGYYKDVVIHFTELVE